MAYLLHSDFFLLHSVGVIYVLYIITNVFGKISLKIIPRIIAVSKSFLWYMSFILSMSFFYLFTKKLYRESSQLPTFFCYICPLYYQYIFWENSYKKDTAVYPVCQHLFTVLLSSLTFYN